MWPFTKSIPERLEQIVYDVTYKAICPICKTEIIDEEHIYTMPSTSKLLVECETCHAAIYAYEKNIVKTRKTYERVEETYEYPLGLKVIKEEEIH